MHAFLFTGTAHEARTRAIGEFLLSKNVPAHNRVTLAPAEDKASIGIADVREFIRVLSLAPPEGAITAGIVPDAALLTEEAQAALLKTIEEPPAHALICLSAASDTPLLTTIVSRCQVCPVDGVADATPSPDTRMLSVIMDIVSAPNGRRIELIAKEAGPTRKDCTEWIDRAIVSLSGDPVSHATLIHRLLEAKALAVNNINPFHLLEHIFLSP